MYPALACGDLSPRESEQGCVSAKASPEDHPPTEQPVAMGGGTVADRQLLMELNPNMVRVYSEASASKEDLEARTLPLAPECISEQSSEVEEAHPWGWGWGQVQRWGRS